MKSGLMRHVVRVYRMTGKTAESGENPVELSPSPVFAQITPAEPGNSLDDRSLTHRVIMRYHPQVTLDTMLAYGSRQLLVRGLQNVDEMNVELRLLCEEIAQ